MGRKRRQPKDAKEARELERLRNNQQRCRDRKLGLVDEYNKRIDNVKEAINEKIRRQQLLLQEFNKLRLSLQTKAETMTAPEKAAFEQAAQRIDQLEATFIELQHYVRSHVFNQVGCQINRRKNERGSPE